MPTYEISAPTSVRPAAPDRQLTAAIARHFASAFAAASQRREERRTIAQLSRLDPRRLADMGFDPDAIREAADDTWDQLAARPRFPTV